MNKLQKLRALFNQYQIDAFLVPQTDEFQGEHIAPYAERLRWLTNFTGSAGLAIVTKDKAALFVDARYTLQAKQEVASSGFSIFEHPRDKLTSWLQENVGDGPIGFDPWLQTVSDIERYNGFHLQEVPNLIDLIWLNQPELPKRQFIVHPVQYAGQTHQTKLADLTYYMQEKRVDALILVDSASIAWLLNLRGNDIKHTPVTLAYAIVFLDKVDVYANEKQDPEIFAHLGANVQIKPINHFVMDLQEMKGLTISFDAQVTPYKIETTIREHNILITKEDPCLYRRAVKNKTEQAGMRQCHIRDGIALTKFMFWLEHNSCSDEYTAAQKLLEFRKQQDLFQQPSFETISAFAENGAIVHYRPNANLTRLINSDGLLLVDSGGQYLDGTTDVTRVMVIGRAEPEHIENYTRVLKGHIGLARAKFPRGITGPQLDVLARIPLWQVGKDFAHATGHGVGSYLNVHEGPHYIGRTTRFNTPLEPGMIVSNEPGYYEENAFGIRIETLMLVIEDPELGPEFLSFETLTMAPLEPKLIDINALNDEELRWLNRYHEQVAQTLMPYMDMEEKVWLTQMTRPILRKVM